MVTSGQVTFLCENNSTPIGNILCSHLMSITYKRWCIFIIMLRKKKALLSQDELKYFMN